MLYVNRIVKWSPARVEVKASKPQEEQKKDNAVTEETETPKRGRKPKDEQ